MPADTVLESELIADRLITWLNELKLGGRVPMLVKMPGEKIITMAWAMAREGIRTGREAEIHVAWLQHQAAQ